MLDIIIARDEISRNDRENTLSISAAIFFSLRQQEQERGGWSGRPQHHIKCKQQCEGTI
jgi:hypothetical protein